MHTFSKTLASHVLRVSPIVALIVFAFPPGLGADPTKPVSVENTPSVVVDNIPLPIVDVDSSALQPHQAQVQLNISSGDSDDPGVVTTVPAGKRLVIETVTGLCFKGSPNSSHRIGIETTGGGSTVEFNLPPAAKGIYGRYDQLGDFEGTLGSTSIAFGGPLKLYADPSTDVVATARRNIASGDTTCWISLAGYYVDL